MCLKDSISLVTLTNTLYECRVLACMRTFVLHSETAQKDLHLIFPTFP